MAKKNYIVIYLTHSEEESVVTEIVSSTVKNKNYKHMTSVKYVY